MDAIWVLNGPGLSLLGQREPAIYGAGTLDTIIGELRREAELVHCVELVARQSNHEGALLDWLCEADTSGARAVLMNAGGFSHTSVALHDTIRGINVPVISIHLSNIAARESFRQCDLVAAAARGSVAGFGALSYRIALTAAMSL